MQYVQGKGKFEEHTNSACSISDLAGNDFLKSDQAPSFSEKRLLEILIVHQILIQRL